MYTIKRAAQLTGVPETSLRAWERRYGVWAPHRNEAGYRVYDQESLAVISTMRRLVDDGWSPTAAADAVRNGTIPPALVARVDEESREAATTTLPGSTSYTERFLRAAAEMDVAAIEDSLDGGFSLGSFEHVVDAWLFPTLESLGDGWARGEIDVAGEHAASHAVHRRLAAAFDAAGSRSRGPAVVVGLPSGSQHDLGALAFATAIRRRGLHVLYLGADVPVSSWEAAVASHSALAAILAVVTPQDRPAAITVAERLAQHQRPPLVCAGGASGADLAPGVLDLPWGIGDAAQELDRLTDELATQPV
ncbi:MerR family transcriptional regulator [Nocardioides sp.]|uniref:MerR family transcriptional regulator n=1 Tax=Nocardioides sp. TaxID=35761 RepID=UPI002BB57B75|nr:MerR family transcriptional regulator [Nocardioides sp.]HXH78567.1 MerR family transcriptional regulator [Nocardioides sp.]